VGIHVDVQALPKRRFFPLLASGESTLYLMGWSCDTLEAGEALSGLFRSSTSGGPNQNYGGLADGVLDRLIDESEHPFDAERRLTLTRAALRRVHELRAIVPLVVEPETLVLHSSVRWNVPLNSGLRGYEMEANPGR
jgi:ABC-type oligopeptide transport system substrate-binding subunit